MTDIYKMKLHETINLSNGTKVMRVPGGWIYRTTAGYSGTKSITSTFVKFNIEFIDSYKSNLEIFNKPKD